MSDQPTDDTTVELAAVVPEPPSPPSPAAQQEAFPVDEEMLAAFLGEAPTPAPAAPAPTPTPPPAAAPAPTPTPPPAAAPAPSHTPPPAAAPAPTLTPPHVAATAAAAAASAGATPAVSGTHAAPRRSAWSTVLIVVGIVVLVVAVGAAGVYVGRLTAPEPEVVLQTQEQVVEQQAGAPLMPVGPLPVPAPGTLVVTTARVPTSTWAVVLNGTAALSDETGSAPGYRLVNQGISGAQVAGILAATFGVSGSATTTDLGWTVGVAGGPTVTVVGDPLFSWTYEDPGAALAASGEEYAPVDAIALATQTLTAIGVDLTSVEYEVGTADGRTVVSAWQVVGEQRTQLGWRMVFDTDGAIVAASGFSSGFQAVPDYPVVGAATAVERSRQAPWTSIPASPISGPTDESDMGGAPAPSASGIPQVDLPMSEVDVLSAELGLAPYWQPDGSILLLPSYILTGADGSTWSLLAVADSSVRFITQPYPLDGEAPAFVPQPFPSPTVDETIDDVTVDSATPSPPMQDDGMLEENGEPIAPPVEDPAAVE